MRKVFNRFQRGRSKSQSPVDSLRSHESSSKIKSLTHDFFGTKLKDLPKLHKAVWKGDIKKVQLLVRREPIIGDRENRTPLHIACSKGYHEITKELLEFNAKVNVTDNSGKTPLLLAIEAKSSECVKLLLDYHADLTFRDARGDAAIHYAVNQSSIEIVSILLSAGVSVNTHNEYGLTPIHLAAKKQDVDMLTFLLENEAEVDCVDQNGRSALMLACIAGNPILSEMLLRAGADVKLKDTEGLTALKYAKMYHNKQCADLVKKSARCESRREFDLTRDSSSDVSYQDIQRCCQMSSDETGSYDKNGETSLSDNVIFEKPPLPPGVISLTASNNSRTNQSNLTNNNPGSKGQFRSPINPATGTEDETGEEILDLVSTSDENGVGSVSSEQNPDVDEQEIEEEEEIQDHECNLNGGDESGEAFVFLHELSRRKFEEPAVLSESSYVSDLIQVDMVGPRSVHFAQSTVGSALDLTRKALELESAKDVHQTTSTIRQDSVRSTSSQLLSTNNDPRYQEMMKLQKQELNQTEDQKRPASPSDMKPLDAYELIGGERSASSRTDVLLSDPVNSLLRGQRPSPDGGTVTTPLPAVSHNSVASVTGTDVSIVGPIAQECDPNDLFVVGSNGLGPNSYGSKETRPNGDLLLKATNDEGDSWQSDTDSHGKEEMRKIEAGIGQKILEHARLSFLSRSTPRLTTSSPSDPVAPELKLKSDANLWENGTLAADAIGEENSWDSSWKEKPKETNQSKNSGILSDSHGVDDAIAANFQANRRIWMYDEFQSNDAQTVDDWDSDSASQVHQMIHNGVCKSNGTELVDASDCIIPKIKPNGLPVHVSLIGPLKQAIEWESDLEENSSDSECKSLEHSIHPSSADDGGETRLAICDKNYSLPEFVCSRPKSEATGVEQNSAKVSTGFRSASANDHVMVSIQSAGSEDEESRAASLSPIAEVEEDAIGVESDMIGLKQLHTTVQDAGEARNSREQNSLPNGLSEQEVGSEKANHQTVILFTSNRFVDDEITETDNIPFVDAVGITKGKTGRSEISPQKTSPFGDESRKQHTEFAPTSVLNALDVRGFPPDAKSDSTLKSVHITSDYPIAKEIFTGQIPQRNTCAEGNRMKEGNMTREEPILTVDPVGSRTCGNDDQCSTTKKHDIKNANDEDLATENEIMCLEDFDEHTENPKWREMSHEIWEKGDLSNASISSKSSDQSHRYIPLQQCASNNASGLGTGLLPAPRTLRSSRSHVKDNGFDPTIQDTDSITLASNTEMLPVLNEAKNLRNGSIMEKVISLTTEPQYGDPKPRTSSHSARSDHVAQAECTEPESELKPNELVTNMGQLYKETQLLLDNACPAQRSREQKLHHELTNSTAATDLLRARLIQALQALTRERACHEELELARDAAKARVRELTLLQAQAVAVETMEKSLSEKPNGQEVKNYAELSSKLMDYRFLLLEEQEKRKLAEESINQCHIEIRKKETKIAQLLKEKNAFEQKAVESSTKIEDLNIKNKMIENIVEDLKMKLETSNGRMERMADLKDDVFQIHRKLEVLQKSWREEFSKISIQLEQHRTMRNERANPYNEPPQCGLELLESSVQVDDFSAKECLDRVNQELLSARTELEQKCLQLVNLEENQSRTSNVLKQIGEKLSDLMNIEETIYGCFESYLYEAPTSETESLDDNPSAANPDGMERIRAFLEVLKANKCELNHCVYQLNHVGLFENQSAWNDQQSSDINELVNTSTVAVEQLSKLGQSLTAKERDVRQLRQALDQAKKDYKQQQSDLSTQLTEAKEEIVRLNQRLHSLQTTEDAKKEVLWTRFTQTECDELANNGRITGVKSADYQGNMKDFRMNSQAGSVSSSIGSVARTRDRSSSPVEQLQYPEISACAKHCSEKNGLEVCNNFDVCEMCLRPSKRVAFESRTLDRQKNTLTLSPHWSHYVVPCPKSHEPVHRCQAESYSETRLSSARGEARRMSDPEPELVALRRRIAELENDRDWLARENSRLVDRTEKQTRITEKLATRLSQQIQLPTIPSPIYPGAQYALPHPIMVPNSCVLASSPYMNPHRCCRSKEPWDFCEDPPITPQRRPPVVDHSPSHEFLSKSHQTVNDHLETANYPEVDQSNFHESTWSLDQHQGRDSVNAQIMECHNSVQKQKFNPKLFDDTLSQLKPELERSINRHLEAADASRAQINAIFSPTVNENMAQKNNSINLILRNAEVSLKTLRNQRIPTSKLNFGSRNYLDFLKQKYFV